MSCGIAFQMRFVLTVSTPIRCFSDLWQIKELATITTLESTISPPCGRVLKPPSSAGSELDDLKLRSQSNLQR